MITEPDQMADAVSFQKIKTELGDMIRYHIALSVCALQEQINLPALQELFENRLVHPTPV